MGSYCGGLCRVAPSPDNVIDDAVEGLVWSDDAWRDDCRWPGPLSGCRCYPVSASARRDLRGYRMYAADKH